MNMNKNMPAQMNKDTMAFSAMLAVGLLIVFLGAASSIISQVVTVTAKSPATQLAVNPVALRIFA